MTTSLRRSIPSTRTTMINYASALFLTLPRSTSSTTSPTALATASAEEFGDLNDADGLGAVPGHSPPRTLADRR